jgi:hypothetical protein
LLLCTGVHWRATARSNGLPRYNLPLLEILKGPRQC